MRAFDNASPYIILSIFLIPVLSVNKSSNLSGETSLPLNITFPFLVLNPPKLTLGKFTSPSSEIVPLAPLNLLTILFNLVNSTLAFSKSFSYFL